MASRECSWRFPPWRSHRSFTVTGWNGVTARALLTQRFHARPLSNRAYPSNDRPRARDVDAGPNGHTGWRRHPGDAHAVLIDAKPPCSVRYSLIAVTSI